MAWTLTYGGDDTDLLIPVVQRCAEGEYVVTVTPAEAAVRSGAVVAADHLGSFTVDLLDPESDERTGNEMTFDLSDVAELEIH